MPLSGDDGLEKHLCRQIEHRLIRQRWLERKCVQSGLKMASENAPTLNAQSGGEGTLHLGEVLSEKVALDSARRKARSIVRSG